MSPSMTSSSQVRLGDDELANLLTHPRHVQTLVREALTTRIERAAAALAEELVPHAIVLHGKVAEYDLEAKASALGWSELGLSYEEFSNCFMANLRPFVTAAAKVHEHSISSGQRIDVSLVEKDGHYYIVAQLADSPSRMWD